MNEDAAFAGPRLLAVADGMGGHPHGDIASRTAIRTLAGVFAADPAAAPAASAAVPAGAGASAPADAAADTAADLAAGIAAVSARLDELGRDDPEMSGMGTALTAMAWDGSGFDVAHVGDSRVYLLRAGELHRLTRDHTTVQALADGGKLAEGESGRRPGGSEPVKALRSGGDAEPDFFRHEAEPGDRYLICSDGVADHVGPEDVRETLVRAASPAEAVTRLLGLAAEAGGQDDATCVVADVVAATREVPREPLMIGAAREPALFGRLAGLARRGRRTRRTRRPAAAGRR